MDSFPRKYRIDLDGPAYWRAEPEGRIRKGCWFEDTPPPCETDAEQVVGFGKFSTESLPSVRRGYRFTEEPSSVEDLPESWSRLRRLDQAGPNSDPVLVSPVERDFLDLFEGIKNRDNVFCDLRSTPETTLNTFHELPVDCWLHPPNETDRVPSYYPSDAFPRGSGGSSPVFLLIHGYTGLPENWDYLTRELNGYGYYAPLLPGHGLEPKAFADFGSQEWSGSTRYWADRLNREHASTIGVGLSMGGALVVANWEQFDALVLINTPLRIPDWRRMFLPLFEWMKSYHQFDDSRKVVPVSSLRDLGETLRRCRERLEEVEVPVLVVNHRQDQTVSVNHGRVFASRLPDSQHLVLERGIHESPTEPDVARRLHEEMMKWLNNRGLIPR